MSATYQARQVGPARRSGLTCYCIDILARFNAMKKKQKLALMVGIIGLIIVFFFPEPETNFIYYVGFVIFLILTIIVILAHNENIRS
jgi:glycerol-3-phosphate acyltransferase PlsY